MNSRLRCDRCNRRLRNPKDWNGIFNQGALIAVICPDCQTLHENGEAEINAATLVYDYRRGRHLAQPKIP